MQSISREQLKQAVERREVVLLDALSPEQFKTSHIPTAMNLPLESVSDLAPQLLPDKNAPIVTYCLNFTWKRSEQLARELAAMGYTNVRNYQEGKQDWFKAGLPLEGEAPHEQPNGFHPSTSDAEGRARLKQAS